MSLKNIKIRLENSGYEAKLRDHNYLVVGQIGERIEELNLNLFKHYCDIRIEEGTYLVRYGTTNVQPVEIFSTLSEVVSFIKREYPI